MTTKGQVTLPKDLRDRLGLRQGDVVEFIEEDGKIVMRRAQSTENPFLEWAHSGRQAGVEMKQPSVDWQRELRGWDETDRDLLG